MPSLKLQARPQALVLADLEVRIAWAEKVRDHYYAIVTRVLATRQNPKRARMRLQHAEERLAQLQRSREVLIGGENQSEAEAEAS